MQFYIILILFVNIIITSCTTIHDPACYTFDHQYQIARNKLLHKNYTGAIQDLINLQNLYLFDPYPQQIYLDLIYAYYKSHNLKLANDTIQNFLQIYPNHKNLDYVLYMNGIVNMSLDKKNTSFFTKYLNINWNDFNPNYANHAFYSFLQLIDKYPNSQYYIDAHKRLIILKNRIAEYELSVIQFYDKRSAYISVIIRTEKMLRYFPDAQATRQALYYMKKAYRNLNLSEQANKIDAIIANNSIIY